MKNIYDNRGFTLIEMLVAATVSSVILLMVYTAYSSVIKSVNYGRTFSSYYERLNFALRRIDTDISNLYWNSEQKNLNFICNSKSGSSILNFVTAENRELKMLYNLKDQVPVSDVHEVGFYLKKNNDNDSFDLIRRCSIGYDDSPEEGGNEETLLKNVKSLKFEFKYRSDWTPEWDSRETKRIPSVIKTVIEVYTPSAKTDLYEFISLPNIMSE
ncbi:MAG TPA: prepilin-type N-terminal cleavage/methylation domain-containing protein [Spirochaetota bacterium]|nr:prepilin-type N-terminal cleavage/methylation domain-containing protein [Spirochaetota bacterium]HPF04429.1 prepilin-type N-terminal cleavage/methylation domain-containing protein [Spirochaetota bacterium]HPJ40799.1 prepilin-type N-terminal cleavage/methylation domain-containing protein [Spirochaetota bacterium]HPR36068.1 prepilin-type N-terminal cleavage/methylation domain-containing protein [Spirochaetota bacterium]HRX45982.1 prepilin-type N-terminal cleavage/methylation domain-containing 